MDFDNPVHILKNFHNGQFQGCLEWIAREIIHFF